MRTICMRIELRFPPRNHLILKITQTQTQTHTASERVKEKRFIFINECQLNCVDETIQMKVLRSPAAQKWNCRQRNTRLP